MKAAIYAKFKQESGQCIEDQVKLFNLCNKALSGQLEQLGSSAITIK